MDVIGNREILKGVQKTCYSVFLSNSAMCVMQNLLVGVGGGWKGGGEECMARLKKNKLSFRPSIVWV